MMSEFTFVIQNLLLVLLLSTLPGCLGWLKGNEKSEKKKKKSVRFLDSEKSSERSRTDSIKPPTPSIPDSPRQDGGMDRKAKRAEMKKEILKEMELKGELKKPKIRMVGTRQESQRLLKERKEKKGSMPPEDMDENKDRVEEERKRLTKVVENLEQRWAREDLEDLEESTDELSVFDPSPPTVGEDGFYEDSEAEDPTYWELMGKQTGWLKNWERRVMEKKEGDELKMIKYELAANEKIGKLVKKVDEKKKEEEEKMEKERKEKEEKEKEEKEKKAEKKASEKTAKDLKASEKMKSKEK